MLWRKSSLICWVVRKLPSSIDITWEIRRSDILAQPEGSVLVVNHQSELDLLGNYNYYFECIHVFFSHINHIKIIIIRIYRYIGQFFTIRCLIITLNKCKRNHINDMLYAYTQDTKNFTHFYTRKIYLKWGMNANN